jgi:hypothetical protein
MLDVARVARLVIAVLAGVVLCAHGVAAQSEPEVAGRHNLERV